MAASEKFDSWIKTLSSDEKEDVLDHIYSTYIRKRLSEGVYGGPAPLMKGLFAGPSSSLPSVCPTCKRPW